MARPISKGITIVQYKHDRKDLQPIPLKELILSNNLFYVPELNIYLLHLTKFFEQLRPINLKALFYYTFKTDKDFEDLNKLLGEMGRTTSVKEMKDITKPVPAYRYTKTEEEGETEDEVWVIVNRNGRRYVEYFMSRDFKTGESGLRPYPYFFVDSGLTFDGGDPVKIIGVSKTNPVVISYSGIIDPTNGWTVRLESLSGMDEINDDVFTVAGVNAGANTFQLSGVDGTDFTDYVSGGTWERVVDNVTGIGHLSGCEVDVCADGNSIGPLNVSGATLNLGGYYNRVSAGLHYDYVVEPQPVEINTQFGTSVGITKRVEKLTAMLYETIGCKAGTSLNNVQDLIAPLNSELFTGDVSIEFPGDYDTKVLLTFLHDEPLPCTILGGITLMAAGER